MDVETTSCAYWDLLNATQTNKYTHKTTLSLLPLTLFTVQYINISLNVFPNENLERYSSNTSNICRTFKIQKFIVIIFTSF